MKARNDPPLPLERRTGSADVPSRLRRLAASQGFAVLATMSGEGPRLSLVAFAVTPDLREACFATPRNTTKYRNILADGRVALLLDSRGKKGVRGVEALALSGRARVAGRGKRRDELAARILARHPELEVFLSAPRTAVIRVDLERATHVEDFQCVSEGAPWTGQAPKGCQAKR
jgi:hypothetical protein